MSCITTLEFLWWIRALLYLTPTDHNKKAVSCPKDLTLQKAGQPKKWTQQTEGENGRR